MVSNDIVPTVGAGLSEEVGIGSLQQANANIMWRRSTSQEDLDRRDVLKGRTRLGIGFTTDHRR